MPTYYITLNDFIKAKQYYEEVLHVYKERVKKNPETFNPGLTSILNNLGVLLSNHNEPKQAKDCYQEALEIYKELVMKNSKTYSPVLVSILNNMVVLYHKINNRKETEKAYKEALTTEEILAKGNHSAYEIDYLQTLIFGIDCLEKESKEIQKVKVTLQKYPNDNQAIALLEAIKSWEEENPNA